MPYQCICKTKIRIDEKDVVRGINYMRGLILVFCSLLFIVGCKKADNGELAANAAKTYYDYLLQGKCDDFVAGIHQPDSIPESYRMQLVDNTRMFVAQMKKEHGGLKEVSVNGNSYDEKQQTCNAFLILSFNNGDVEQIVVPMVLHDGLWLMR